MDMVLELSRKSMSRIEELKIEQYNLDIEGSEVRFNQSKHLDAQLLPQIYWKDHTGWEEANLYAYDLVVNGDIKLKTIKTEMMHLNAYATWLEENEIDWLQFPEKKSERCIFLFRGYLVKKRENNELSPSTITHRMRSVIKFYKWIKSNNFIDQDKKIWRDKFKKFTFINKFGFEKTFEVMTNDAAIPLNKNNSGCNLEGGISPINPADVVKIIEFTKSNAPKELYLMLKLGFYTGMRIGSIADLKVQTIENFIYLKNTSMATIAIGLNANPPVQTKYSKSGSIIIPTELVNELLEYAYDVRRLKRIKKIENNDILFLTTNGNKYLDDSGKAINVAMYRLRKYALEKGVHEFKDFYFHRTRATFATVLMQYCLKNMDVVSAVQLVRDCCLHKDEKTTLEYVQFIKQHEKLANLSNEYTELFLGLNKSN